MSPSAKAATSRLRGNARPPVMISAASRSVTLAAGCASSVKEYVSTWLVDPTRSALRRERRAPERPRPPAVGWRGVGRSFPGVAWSCQGRRPAPRTGSPARTGNPARGARRPARSSRCPRRWLRSPGCWLSWMIAAMSVGWSSPSCSSARGVEIGDEAAVDLEEADGEVLQARQGRVTGAEVIDTDPDPKGDRPGEDPRRPPATWSMTMLSVSSNRSDPGASPRRPESPGEDVLQHRPSPSCRAEMFTETHSGSGTIDRHASSCRNRLHDDPLPDRHDQPAALGRLEELLGPRKDPGRMSPAQQRLRADDRAVREPHDGLVEHVELIALERLFEMLDELDPLPDLLLHGGVEDVPAVSTAGLRPVHRGVGVAQQRAGLDAMSCAARSSSRRRR